MSDTQAPVASVLIPAYNAKLWLPTQLEALAAQVDAPAFEVVVSDNGSSDGTAEWVSSGSWPFPVRVVDSSDRRGASHARNVAAASATTDLLLFCDADDAVGPTWVAALLHGSALHPDDVLTGPLLHERFNDADLRQAYDVGRDPDHRALEWPPSLSLAEPFAGFLPSAASCNLCCRRSTYFACGGMDESYNGGSEDTDWVWRLQHRAGRRLWMVSSAYVHYRLRDTPREIVRQQRSYQRERVLLWTRFRDTGMHGPSLRVSVVELVRSFVGRVLATTRADRLRQSRLVGGHLGALEGIIRYRLLRRTPTPAVTSEEALARGLVARRLT